MAATFISALVIKHNNDVYMDTDTLTAGVTMDIPTPGAGGITDGDFWAVPITDNVVSGYNFIPTSPDSTDKPTSQSFHVFRLISRFGYDSWYVRGTTTAAASGSPSTCGYIQAAADAECCDATPCQLPTDTPVIAPCQTMCEWDTNSKYFATFSLPTLAVAGYRYYPYGYYNGTLLTAASAIGYGSKGALLTFLNSGAWGAIGTWSYADAGQTILKVTQTAGTGTAVICIAIIALNPSA